MRDTLVVLSLSAGLALAATAHLAIVYGLLLRPPRWRAIVALFFPPVSPFWAFHEGMRLRPLALIAGSIAYVVGAWLASRP